MKPHEFKQNYIINSINRIVSYSDDPTNFKVNCTPHLTNVNEITLESVSLPFNWNNVVPEYGNQIRLHFDSNSLDFDIITTIPTGFYNMSQLITLINSSCQTFFSLLPVAAPKKVCPFTLTLNPVTTHVDISYDDSNWGPNCTITFLINWGVIGQVISRPYHIYQMLGLSIDNTPSNTFNFPVSGVLTFPISYANRLPISYVLISIEECPPGVLTTGGKSAQFYVDVTSVVQNGERINAPVQYRRLSDYYNTVIIGNQYFNMKELQITVTDSQGLSLKNQNPKEWSMVFSFIRSLKQHF